MFNKELISILNYLAPGLLTVLLINFINIRKEPKAQDVIIQSFVFTAIISQLSSLVSQNPIYPYLLSLAFATLISYGFKDDWYNAIFNFLGISEKSTKMNTWIDVLSADSFIRVIFKDGYQLQGYLRRCSKDKEEGLIYMDQVSWVTDDQFSDVDVKGILINYSDIDYIYILKDKEDYG